MEQIDASSESLYILSEWPGSFIGKAIEIFAHRFTTKNPYCLSKLEL